MQLEQVSAGSHLLPNTLQKWHVASKALEQNQTNINNKLQKMQTSLSSIEKEVTVNEVLEKNIDFIGLIHLTANCCSGAD